MSRPCRGEITKWWELTDTRGFEDRFPEHLDKILGTVGKIPPQSYLALQLRTQALEAKHFSFRNSSVANRDSVAKVVAGVGSVQVGGFEKEFYLPETVGEIVEAIMNYQVRMPGSFN